MFVDKYLCVSNGECSMFKVLQIVRLFVNKIREEFDYFIFMKIEEIIQEKWGIIVSRF